MVLFKSTLQVKACLNIMGLNFMVELPCNRLDWFHFCDFNIRPITLTATSTLYHTVFKYIVLGAQFISEVPYIMPHSSQKWRKKMMFI